MFIQGSIYPQEFLWEISKWVSNCLWGWAALPGILMTHNDPYGWDTDINKEYSKNTSDNYASFVTHYDLVAVVY